MAIAAVTRLTQAELGIWLGHQRAADPTVFHAAEAVILDGPLDERAFGRALEGTVAEATALHVAFVEQDGAPARSSRPFRGAELSRAALVVEASHGGREVDAAIEAHALAFARQPLDLEAGVLARHQLVRLGPARSAWIHVAHHIALDGYAFQLVARRVAARYAAELARAAPLGDGFTPHAPVLAEDDAYQASAARATDRQFWVDALGERRAAIATVGAAPSRGARQRLRLSRELLAEVRAQAERAGVTWPDVLLAVAAARIGEATATRSFVLGLPVMLRLGSKALRTPCMAMNIAPLPIDLDAATDTLDLARRIRATLARQRPHHRYRYEHLRIDRGARRGRTFGPVVNVLPFDSPVRFGNCAARVVRVAAGPVEDLALSFALDGDALDVTVERHPEVVPASVADDVGAALFDDISAWVRDPTQRWDSRRGDSGGRAARARETQPAPPAPTEGAAALVTALKEHARAQPEAVALVAGTTTLTFAELDAAATRGASWLRGHGCRSGDLIAIALNRGAPAVVAILGALYAGVGYVAVDPGHPVARRARVVALAAPVLVIVDDTPSWSVALPSGTRLVRLPAALVDGQPVAETLERDEDARVSETAPAYVVFTSGSTGEAKGVVVSRAALTAFVSAARNAYALGPGDRVLQFAPLTFDASVEEIFVTFAAGACLVIRDEAALESPAQFFASCARDGITVLDLPTAYWHELALAVAERGIAVPPAVRLVIIGGEAASPRRVVAWNAATRGVRLLNTYGPSEATVVATSADISTFRGAGPVPIGTPLPGSGLRALVWDDETQAPVSGPRVAGELVLLGNTLADGYLGRPDLTAERFVMLPCLERAYRTGDRAMYDDDGQLVYLGRTDDEIKISGHRVAPAEVEAALARNPAVRAAVVWGEAGRDGAARLVAHVEVGGEAAVDAAALRRAVAEVLPGPMVPAVLELHRRLPRNAHGKVDRSALRTSRATRVVAEDVGAMTPAEARVIEAWRAVLGVERVRLDDDFFALGGHSLNVLQLANRLSAPGVELRVATIFRHPTPRAQARFLTTAAPLGDDAFEPIAIELPCDAFPPRPTAPASAGRVLLTGASGFVGAHLLAAWLERTAATVVCVVRAADEAEGRARLTARAEEVGVDLAPYAPRIEVHAIDLADEGATDQALSARIPACATIVHGAAQVSLTRDYASLARVNVAATCALLATAARWGAAFHYVSSIAVIPRSAQGCAPEAFVAKHDGLRDGYQRSKWHGEALCKAAAAAGLVVAVHRLGRVSGARRAPRVHGADLAWRIARAATRAGAFPALDVREPWIPADVAAEAIVALATGATPEGPRVYHLTHAGTVGLYDVRDALIAAGYDLETVPLAAFLDRVRAHGDDEDLATLAFFDLAFGGQPARADALASAPVTLVFDASNVERRLGKAEGIGPALLAAYCAHARAAGILPPLTRTSSARANGAFEMDDARAL